MIPERIYQLEASMEIIFLRLLHQQFSKEIFYNSSILFHSL